MINRVVVVNIDKINQHANAKGLSLTGLEEQLKFSNGTICKWKNVGASANALYQVAEYLGTSMIDLLERR